MKNSNLIIIILIFCLVSSQNFNLNKPFERISKIPKININKLQISNKQNNKQADTMRFKQLNFIDVDNQISLQQRVINTRRRMATLFLFVWMLIGHFLNLLVYQDIPVTGFPSSFQLSALTVHRIGCEKQQHDFKDKVFQGMPFPGQLQRAIWLTQEVLSSTSDIQNMDVDIQYDNLDEKFNSVALDQNLLKLLIAGVFFGFLTFKDKMSISLLGAEVFQVFNIQSRVGFGFQPGSVEGTGQILMGASLASYSNSVIQLLAQNQQSFVGSLLDSVFDKLDMFRKFQVQGGVFMAIIFGMARVVHNNLATQILDVDAAHQAARPWWMLALPFWHVVHAIGLDFTPVSDRDRAFFSMYMFHMGMLGDKFQTSASDLIDQFLGQVDSLGKFAMWNIVLAFIQMVMDMSITNPTPTKIVEAFQQIYDIGSTIGNADLRASTDIGNLMQIPFQQFASQGLSQIQANSNTIQDRITAYVIQKKYGSYEYFYQAKQGDDGKVQTENKEESSRGI